MNNPSSNTNRAILFTAKTCPHCPSVKKVLTDLHQSGELAQLDIYDIAEDQELAAQYRIRSVPWFKIGELEFQGLHTASELHYWVKNASREEGILRYIIEKLKEGKLNSVETLIEQHHDYLPVALQILKDVTAPIQARIGLGAVLEGLAGTALLDSTLPILEKYTRHEDHRVRGDACHYLGFIDKPESKEILKQCLRDENSEVREIAQDSLDELEIE